MLTSPTSFLDRSRAALACIEFKIAGLPATREHALDALVALCGVPMDRKIILVGNGGSASIAQHLAVDFLTQARIFAQAPMCGVLSTAAGNDYGFASSLSRPVEMLAAPLDVLVAMSCSGESVNVLCAVESAMRLGMRTVTLSGFAPTNALRAMPTDVSVHVASHEYGAVQIAHLAVMHAVVDALAARRGGES